jgi:lysozyme family protein
MPFDDIYDYATAGFEGGYVNDPYDSGGETYKGISRRSWPSWPGWKAIDEAKVKFGPLYPNYPKALADAINARFKGDAAMAGLVRDLYRKEFWDKTAFPAKAYTDRIHGKVFDTAVNAGISRAVKIL